MTDVTYVFIEVCLRGDHGKGCQHRECEPKLSCKKSACQFGLGFEMSADPDRLPSCHGTNARTDLPRNATAQKIQITNGTLLGHENSNKQQGGDRRFGTSLRSLCCGRKALSRHWPNAKCNRASVEICIQPQIFRRMLLCSWHENALLQLVQTNQFSLRPWTRLKGARHSKAA